ncbi:D-inositol-3-phosphate glycosyltransferase [subsurface metagenome]
MKILLVQESDWLKRGPHQQHHLMERLSIKGHDIHVIDYEVSWKNEINKEIYSQRKVFNKVSKFYDGANIYVIRPAIIKIPILDYISIILTHGIEIRKQIKNFKPDVIIGFGILNTFIAAILARRNNIPFIYYLIDELHRFIAFKILQPLGEIIKSRTLKLSDKVIVINEKLRDYVISLGANPQKTYIVSAGVDLDRFLNSNDRSIRKEYGIKKDDIVLFFMGYLYNFSGLKEVALELAKLKDKERNIKLLIVGEGDIYNDLQEIKDKYKLKDKIILTGKQPYKKIPNFIAASDICLLPAQNTKIMRNIVPIKMYEYMAANKAIITTKLSGIMKEFGEDHGVVYVDKPEDVLNKAIELIKSNSIEKEGRKARKFVKKYDWDDIVDEFERLLEELT